MSERDDLNAEDREARYQELKATGVRHAEANRQAREQIGGSHSPGTPQEPFDEKALAALAAWLPEGKKLLDSGAASASAEWNKSAADLCNAHGLTLTPGPLNFHDHTDEAWRRLRGETPRSACSRCATCGTRLVLGDFPDCMGCKVRRKVRDAQEKPPAPVCGHRDCIAVPKLCLAHAVAEGRSMRRKIRDLEDETMALRARLADAATQSAT